MLSDGISKPITKFLLMYIVFYLLGLFVIDVLLICIDLFSFLMMSYVFLIFVLIVHVFLLIIVDLLLTVYIVIVLYLFICGPYGPHGALKGSKRHAGPMDP